MFIVFEGVDGCGKSTQLQRCHRWLAGQGLPVVTCRDPGSTPLGDRVRSLLLDQGDIEISDRAEMLLFMAARAQLVDSLIRPALLRGDIVLCDRYLLSTIVYQGHAGSLNTHEIEQVGEIATGGVQPDMTLVFDVPIEAALQRIGDQTDRVEARGRDYLERVRGGFQQAATDHPGSLHVIDGSDSPEQVHAQVQKLLVPILEQRK